MDDHQIHECIDKKNTLIIDTVTRLFDSHTSSIATLITNETEGIKKHIEKLENQVILQNGSVKGLREWRARIEGKEEGSSEGQKKRLTSIQQMGIVVAIIVGLTTATLSVVNAVGNQKREAKVERVENWMELWDFSPITRGGKPILDTTKFEIK